MKHLALALIIATAGNYLAAAESGNAPLSIEADSRTSWYRRANRPFCVRFRWRKTVCLCALGNHTVEVLDLRKAERIHSITGLGESLDIPAEIKGESLDFYLRSKTNR